MRDVQTSLPVAEQGPEPQEAEFLHTGWRPAEPVALQFFSTDHTKGVRMDRRATILGAAVAPALLLTGGAANFLEP